MKPVTLDREAGLVIVDVQNDFCPGGALPVKDGHKVVPVFNQYLELFDRAGAPIYATRDWHPANHCSFKVQGGPWPPHCVQGTPGAEFHPDLKVPYDAIIISKAWRAQDDPYSEFAGTNLELDLKRRRIRRVFIGGLATDYCVKATTLDACQLGFETYLLTDASRGIDVKAGDCRRALEAMKKAGAIPITLQDIA